jgi:hypothetical protein
MMKKTKVIAVRVTEEQYVCLSVMANGKQQRMGEYVYDILIPSMAQGADLIKKEQKRLEAKAKRLAKKEAASGL